jgi:hypothetical protein
MPLQPRTKKQRDERLEKWPRRCANGHEEVRWHGYPVCWYCKKPANLRPGEKMLILPGSQSVDWSRMVQDEL